MKKSADAPAALRDSKVQVVAGTGWLFARADMASTVDVLFIDEASQLSLANGVAASPAARSLVLLGDPQQLDQPVKGQHPPGAEASVLGHLLGDHKTIPPALGLFLSQTRRLHPTCARSRRPCSTKASSRASLATAGATPIARLESQIAPESLAPAVGILSASDGVGAAFGLPSGTVVDRNGRYDGHLFLLVSGRGRFTEPDRLEMVTSDRRPGETAFVLARAEVASDWRYCGVARWLDAEEQWGIPPLDFATWRALGKGRECSRRPSPSALEDARIFIAEVVRRAGPAAWIERDGKRCRIVEGTAGGVWIDGGEGGFGRRQVSITDLAWVLMAAEAVKAEGGVLDEPRVNRLRYLDGTPKESTRWIDTGWAIVLVAGVAAQ